MAAQAQGQEQIRRYLLNPARLWSPYGVRTLAADDPTYNNVNMIKPYSNWQGPVWPIANYLYMHALLNYGFRTEAMELAQRIVNVCLQDIQHSGGMHENYDAETGAPLAAPNFVCWNILVSHMMDEASTGANPFAASMKGQ
jgi:alpha,alpha-trehalase